MGTKQLQKQIRDILDELGWSFRKLADVVYEARYAEDSDDFGEREEIKKLAEKIKKHLCRETTPELKLREYLTIIQQHPDFMQFNLGMVMPQYLKHENLGDDLRVRLERISKDLDEDLRNCIEGIPANIDKK